MALPDDWFRHPSHVRSVNRAENEKIDRAWARKERREITWTWTLVLAAVLIAASAFLLILRLVLR